MATNPYKSPDHAELNPLKGCLPRGYLFATLGTLAVWMVGLVFAEFWFGVEWSGDQIVFSIPGERTGESPEWGSFVSYDVTYWVTWEGVLLLVVILVLISLAIVNAIVWFCRFRALKRA